jgi:hypothetical protein
MVAENDPKDIARTKQILSKWFKNKVLTTEQRQDKNRHKRSFVIPGPWAEKPTVDEPTSMMMNCRKPTQTDAATVLEGPYFCVSAPVAPVPYRTGNWSDARGPRRITGKHHPLACRGEWTSSRRSAG